jgi:uncharacterized protein YbcI
LAGHVEGSAEGSGSGETDRGEQAATISREMVKLLRHVSGRGPTKARTTIGRDHVLVMFENTLNEGEKKLVERGRREEVAAVRRAFQEVMEADACVLVGRVTGREVSRFMSANHLDAPDAAAEVLLLASDGASDEQPREAEHREDPDDRRPSVVLRDSPPSGHRNRRL